MAHGWWCEASKHGWSMSTSLGGAGVGTGCDVSCPAEAGPKSPSSAAARAVSSPQSAASSRSSASSGSPSKRSSKTEALAEASFTRASELDGESTGGRAGGAGQLEPLAVMWERTARGGGRKVVSVGRREPRRQRGFLTCPSDVTPPLHLGALRMRTSRSAVAAATRLCAAALPRGVVPCAAVPRSFRAAPACAAAAPDALRAADACQLATPQVR